MATDTDKTINYYNKNAEVYAQNSDTVSMSKELEAFIATLPSPKEKPVNLLEIGAGSGRDLMYMLSKGFKVTVTEPSEEFCKIIKAKTGIAPIQEKAEDLNFYRCFDGIYAVASLLHVPKDDFPGVLQKVSTALVEDGQLLLVLKCGDGEAVDDKGRFFSYYQPDEVQKILEESGFKDVKMDVSGDYLSRGGLQWMTVIAKNNPEYILKNDKATKVENRFK